MFIRLLYPKCWCAIFEFTTVAGESSQLRIDRAQSRNVQFVYRALLRSNADLPTNEAEAHYLVQTAIESENPPLFNYATTLGWHSNTKGFLFWDTYVPRPGETNLIFPPDWVANYADGHLVTAGKLRHWQKYIGSRAAGSSRLILLAAAAFAAPLVHFTNQPNPGLNLFGLSGPEIDVAGALVGSILGQGAGDAVSEWWLDPTALLKRAQLFGDLVFLAGNPLPYPERMATRQQQERLLRLRAGDARASTAISSTTIGSQAVWRGIFVTLLPHSNCQSRPAGPTNDTHDAGICVDIPPAKGGSLALIEAPHSGATAADLLPPAHTLRRIPKAARRYYGTPIRSYIRYLVQGFDRLPSKISELKARFHDLERSQKLKYAPFPMIDCFALLYAGGCLAIASGVLPWKEAHLHAALHECLIAAIKHQRAGQFGPKAIRRILRQQLRAPNVVLREHSGPFGPDQHDGFYEVVGGRRRYTIHAKAFRRWFGSSVRCASSVAWLHKKGLLVMGDKRAVPNSTSTDWAERTPRWPDGRVQKSFVFYEIPPSPPPAKAIKGR